MELLASLLVLISAILLFISSVGILLVTKTLTESKGITTPKVRLPFKTKGIDMFNPVFEAKKNVPLEQFKPNPKKPVRINYNNGKKH